MLIELILNGKKTVREVDCGMSLLQFLREEGCFSVKCACSTENCGLCTVWVDEKPVLSCAYPLARVSGHRVTTLEGVREEAKKLGDCMASEGAEQCGFCSPGFIMNVLAMANELRNPTDEEIRAYLAGNLCRCTGYASQMRAVRKYLEGKQA